MFMSVSSFIYYSFFNLKFAIGLIGLFWRARALTETGSLCYIRLAFVKRDFYFRPVIVVVVVGRAHRPQRPALDSEERSKTSDGGGGGVPINVVRGLKVSSLITTISLIVLDSRRRLGIMNIFLNETLYTRHTARPARTDFPF